MVQTHAQDAQQRWAQLPIRDRLRVLAKARNLVASDASQILSAGGSFGRKPPAEALTSEVLPLLAGIRFLEDSAEKILKPRRPGSKGLPLWLRGVQSEVHRVPFGKILVIGPSNYPLFLPGLQTVQALAAGNAVVWKPGIGGREVAASFARVLAAAGLPQGVLEVTDESVAAAERVIDAGVDKVFLTGSAASGRALLRRLADKLIPGVVELSGCDAVVVLKGADMNRVERALTFGVRLNGSSTCMAPRRILLVGMSPEEKKQFVDRLITAFQAVSPVPLPDAIRTRLANLLEDSRAAGASVCGDITADRVAPILVVDGAANMAVAQEDIFAPVVTLIEVNDGTEVLAAQAACPFGLTASLFGPEAECRALAEKLDVGTVFINDLIVPSADPRVPFGGRRLSGFGVTQGAEGLLEMTAIKTVVVQKSTNLRHYDESTSDQLNFLTAIVRAVYTTGLSSRLRGTLQTIREGRHLR